MSRHHKEDSAEYIVKKIVKQLKLLRLAQGMSHEVLAQKTGITRPAISHIENGKRKPSLLLSIKLANALDKQLSEILHQAETDDEE